MATRASLVLRSLYALCMLAGTSTHIGTVITHGIFWDYGGAPLITRIYWTSLIILDPVAAALLFLKPRAGLLLTLAIIGSDVAHKTWLMQRSPTPNWSNWMYVLQVLFLAFVLLTISRAWRGAPGETKLAIKASRLATKALAG
jgi:hypothetical protein